MNLVEIAEQLKDVPDQFLVKEVQQPSGTYPAYLVISEMNRRKRMREGATKEAPKTTVAQDLAAQSRVPQVPQQLSAPQMAPQAGGLNAGLSAAPQAAQDLAAQDVMAGTPLPTRQMAGGGLVAFEDGGRVTDPRDEIARRLSAELGGMSARAVRKPGGYDVRGMADIDGVRPFVDVNPAGLRPTLYGAEYARPIEGGSVQGRVTYDPVARQEMIAAEIQKSLDKASNLSARGMYAPGAGYNVGVQYRRAFKQGGEVVRAANGLPDNFESSYTTPEDVMAYKPLFPYFGSGNVDYQLKNLGYTREEIATMDPAIKQFITQRASTTAPTQAAARAPVPARTPAPAGAVPPQGEAPLVKPLVTAPPFRDVYGPDIRTGQQQISAVRYKTPAELETERQAGIRAYQEEVPFRLGFLEEDIKKRQAELPGRKESNINEALIEAGLRIAGSKSPRFLGAVSEGGLGALKSYKEGVADIRKAEDALAQSKVQYAQAQSLYDQNKFSAGDKKMQQAMDSEKRSVELMSTQQAARVQAAGAAREAYLTPLLGNLYTAQAQAALMKQDKTIATPDQISKARAQAMALAPPNASPKQIEDIVDKILAESNLHRVTTSAPGPVVRGSPNAPLGAQ